MKSPISSKEMKLQTRKEKITFRKEEFEIVYHYFLDEDNDNEFTTTELDELNIKQLHNQYREKYSIPFPDEIREIRERYELPANKMAEVLGFGVNVYRQYETGEIPSVSNGRYLQRMKDPKEFLETLRESRVLQEDDLKEKEKLIHGLIHKMKHDANSLIEEYLFDDQYPNELNGYKKPNIEKFLNMVVYFSHNCRGLTKTKLNKLLFYSDFFRF